MVEIRRCLSSSFTLRAWRWSCGASRLTPCSLRATSSSWTTGSPRWAAPPAGTWRAWTRRCPEPPPGSAARMSCSGTVHVKQMKEAHNNKACLVELYKHTQVFQKVKHINRLNLIKRSSVIPPRETSGQMSRLREKVDEVNWTVGAVNHTFSNDISIHHLKIQDLQVHHTH